MELKPSCFFMRLFLDVQTFKCQQCEFPNSTQAFKRRFSSEVPQLSRSGIARSRSGTCRSVRLTIAYQQQHTCLLNNRPLISFQKTSPRQQSATGTRNHQRTSISISRQPSNWFHDGFLRPC